ncbi:MAG TPA: anthranilate synthase component I [Alphaproteobacteria bacterium]|nr:anthranilate synthase component I [Alphaproteobacteria bacterium]HAJ45391.1 anthranilate synthase component I [Alphaproteobacteria bacterium]
MTSCSPSAADFARAYDEGHGQIVWTRIVADLETPVSAWLKIASARPYSLLLESVQGGEARGRYSIIGLDPDFAWRCQEGHAQICRNLGSGQDHWEPVTGDALASLRQVLASLHMAFPSELPPMAAGLFGYLSYDMVRGMERLPPAKPDPIGLHDAFLIRPGIIAIFDSVRADVTLAAPVWPESGIPSEAAYAKAQDRIARIMSAFGEPLPHGHRRPQPEPATVTSNTKHADYLRAVERAREYIAAGDAFQIVPSQRFQRPFTLPSFSLYRSLRRLNPSPFLYFLRFPEADIVGSSPEILVRLRDGVVTIRPIAGTAPRGATPADDEARAANLIADPKERAEHLMLLDLGRNDVGRVAVPGTVKVTQSFAIERYSHVMHIVSNVEGTLRDGLSAIDALVAGFPAGTLSGAPKVRAMEIINELEPEKRGLYGGAIGYFSANGSMDTCIVLRTAIIRDGMMYVQAGGGVVADSDPEAEYQETVNKAKALFKAAEDAAIFACEGNAPL